MYKLERILCPTDFSAASIEAIRFASFLAKNAACQLTLIHVDEQEQSPLGYFEKDEQTISQHHEHVSGFAQEKFAEIVKQEGLVPERTSLLVRFGTAYHEIVEVAEVNRFSLVVIATEGLGRSSPHLVGRTVERVVRLCRTPVITVKPGLQKSALKVETILCPTDFSEYSNFAIPYAVSIARGYQARIILLHVTDLTVQHPEALLQKFPDPRFYHDEADKIHIEKIVGRDVEPENTIVRLAEEYQVDLIVIGTHGARGMRRVQIGNTVEEVVRRTTSPVLTITHPIHKAVFPRRFKEDYAEEGLPRDNE
jgi:nucleotide-binding universal stress UspA family protein